MMVIGEDVRFEGTVYFAGTTQVGGSGIGRTYLTQNSTQKYMLDFERWRVWNAYASSLPAAGTADDLGLYAGAWATGAPYIATQDLKAAGATTEYARITFCLPPEYVAGQTVTIRAAAGMITTVADTTATIDFECYKSDNDSTIGGGDLVTTSATTINSTTFANKDFTVTATALSPGDVLDIRMAIAVNDAATVTAVIGAAAAVWMLLDIKG